MSTEAQFEANRLNAQLSTGPRTESGKSTSSRNAITLGLYTRQDYVKPDEHDIYRDFCERMILELNPDTLLEETLVAEITGASWRLRRCSAVEAELADFADRDPMLDETKEKTIRSLERARATASSLLHRGINQLRRLQTDRLKPKSEARAMAELEAFCAPPALTPAQRAELASNCSPQRPAAQTAPAPASEPRQIPRSAPCPCRSGEKYKRCCGKNAPPVLSAPVRRAA
jgi:hypothetical protein